MQIIVPSGIWYDKNVELEFPDDWNVIVVEPEFQPPVLSDYEIRAAMHSPIGSPMISQLAKGLSLSEAKGCKSAVIIVDDTTRPTPAHRVAPFVLEELRAGGVEDDDILFVIGLGAHRPMNRIDMVMKLGADIVNRFHVINHDLDGSFVHLGETSHGTPIYINEEVMARDLKLTIGSVIPHGGAGFSGGGKLILPGVSSLETIRHHHTSGLKDADRGGNPDNEFRLDIEEVTCKMGLNAIVNVMINSQREITGVFVGDVLKAHRQAVEFSRKCCVTSLVQQPDIVVTNSYPEDLTLRYAMCGAWPFGAVREGGTKILIAGCPEGTGYHRLYSSPPTPGLKRIKALQQGKSPQPPLIKGEQSVSNQERKDFIMFSPFIGPKEAYEILPNCLFFNSWAELMNEVMREYQDRKNVTVAVYPYAGIQIPE
ncbi:TPA: nickel-dependent lactate racemase [Candidatus Poribacteria bacterium]|nr:nickel-dependent lactate racemase [Candidatus Poribacteria bacterium]